MRKNETKRFQKSATLPAPVAYQIESSSAKSLIHTGINYLSQILALMQRGKQYFGISHLHDGAHRARFATIIKNNLDCWVRQAAYNISRGLKILNLATV